MTAYNFLETPRFPTGISHGSEGGPNFNTHIAPLKSGANAKTRIWQYPLHTYNVLTGIRTPAQLEEVKDYFYVMYGQDGTFRFKDFTDFKSCVFADTPANDDVLLGVGDGSTRVFDMVKRYTKGSMELVRRIQYPLASSIKVAVAGASSASWSQLPWPNTHQIEFATGAIPATGQNVTAGYEFDVVVSFKVDRFNVVIQNTNCQTGQPIFNITALPLGEELIV